jgi:hypothetical protein
MDENLQNKRTSSIFHWPYFTYYIFECVLDIIQLPFFQVLKYVNLVYEWISTISNDMENIVMVSWHFLYLIN